MLRIDGFPIDVELALEPKFESEVTDFPVESGSDITDHIRNLPIEVSVTGIVSDTPIGAIAVDPTRTSSGGIVANSRAAYFKLLRVRDARKEVTLETSQDTFERMAMTSLNPPRAPGQGTAFKFTATFKQIAIVTNNRTTVRVAVPNGAGKVNLGLSESNLVGDKIALWRKGKPPGGQTIIGTEVVHVLNGHMVHADGKTRLTAAENTAFAADLNRDNAAMTTKRLNAVEKQLDANDAKIAKALAADDAKHPPSSLTRTPSSKVFGR